MDRCFFCFCFLSVILIICYSLKDIIGMLKFFIRSFGICEEYIEYFTVVFYLYDCVF